MTWLKIENNRDFRSMRIVRLFSTFTFIFLGQSLASAQGPVQAASQGSGQLALPRSPKAVVQGGVGPTRLFPNGVASQVTASGGSPLVPVDPSRAPAAVAPTSVLPTPTPAALSPFLFQPMAGAAPAAPMAMPSFAPPAATGSAASFAPGAAAPAPSNNYSYGSSGPSSMNQSPSAPSSVDLRAGTTQFTGPQSTGPNSVQSPRCFPEGSQYASWKIGAVYLHGWHDPTDAQPDTNGFNQLESNNREALMKYALDHHIKIALPVSPRVNSSRGFRTWAGVSDGDIENASNLACGGVGFAEKKMLIGFSDGGYKARQMACSSSFFNSVYAIGSPPTASTAPCNSPNLTQINPHVFPPQGAAGASFLQNLDSYASADGDAPAAPPARAQATR